MRGVPLEIQSRKSCSRASMRAWMDEDGSTWAFILDGCTKGVKKRSRRAEERKGKGRAENKGGHRPTNQRVLFFFLLLPHHFRQMNSYKQLEEAAKAILSHPAFDQVQTGPPLENRTPTALRLPPVNISLHDSLTTIGCSTQAIEALENVLHQAVSRLRGECHQAFERTADGLRDWCTLEEEVRWNDWLVSVAQAIVEKFRCQSDLIRSEIVQQVVAAKARHSSYSSAASPPIYPLPSPPPEPVGSFTEEVVSILQKAFDMSESLTRAEVKELIKVTGLNNKQVSLFLPLDQSVELI